MAYFIHNKYDKASIDALATLDTTTNTVVDYYGDYETYKYLDTSAGFGILYDALSYVTPGTVIHGGQSDKDNSHFNFQSSIVIKSIQRGTFNSSGNLKETTVEIAKIDSSKAEITLNGINNASGTSSYFPNAVLIALNDTSFVVKSNFGSSGLFSYQVIEYC